MILSAGMTIKSQTRRQKRIFKAVNGNVSGFVVLTAKGGVKANE